MFTERKSIGYYLNTYCAQNTIQVGTVNAEIYNSHSLHPHRANGLIGIIASS